MANKPEKKFRSGSVSATIWNNKVNKDDQQFDVKSVTLDKNYKDSEGNWKSSNSYSINDLPRLRLVAAKAFEYMSNTVEE